MGRRLRPWIWQLLIAIDQLAHVVIGFFTYVLLGRGSCPNSDETISSRVGRNAMKGRRWALLAEIVIDWLAERLGDEKNHCRRSVGS